MHFLLITWKGLWGRERRRVFPTPHPLCGHFSRQDWDDGGVGAIWDEMTRVKANWEGEELKTHLKLCGSNAITGSQIQPKFCVHGEVTYAYVPNSVRGRVSQIRWAYMTPESQIPGVKGCVCNINHGLHVLFLCACRRSKPFAVWTKSCVVELREHGCQQERQERMCSAHTSAMRGCPQGKYVNSFYF